MPDDYGYGMMGNMWNMMGWGWFGGASLLGLLTWLLLLVFLILGSLYFWEKLKRKNDL